LKAGEFSRNAVDIDKDSVAALSQSLTAFKKELEARADTAPENTITFETVTEWANSKAADKRATFSL